MAEVGAGSASIPSGGAPDKEPGLFELDRATGRRPESLEEASAVPDLAATGIEDLVGYGSRQSPVPRASDREADSPPIEQTGSRGSDAGDSPAAGPDPAAAPPEPEGPPPAVRTVSPAADGGAANAARAGRYESPDSGDPAPETAEIGADRSGSEIVPGAANGQAPQLAEAARPAIEAPVGAPVEATVEAPVEAIAAESIPAQPIPVEPVAPVRPAAAQEPAPEPVGPVPEPLPSVAAEPAPVAAKDPSPASVEPGLPAAGEPAPEPLPPTAGEPPVPEPVPPPLADLPLPPDPLPPDPLPPDPLPPDPLPPDPLPPDPLPPDPGPFLGTPPIAPEPPSAFTFEPPRPPAFAPVLNVVNTRHVLTPEQATHEHVLVEQNFFPALSDTKAIDPAEINGVDLANLELKYDHPVKVIFEGEGAGFKNTLGYYKIDPNGQIGEAHILWSNASAKGSGGTLIPDQSAVDLHDLGAGDRIGFFLIADGASKNQTFFKGSEDRTGHYEFRDQDGTPAGLDSHKPKLVFVGEDGATTALAGDVWHAAARDGTLALNQDGQQHALSGVDTVTGQLTIGFEDLKGGGDRDYNDLVFRVDIGAANSRHLAPELVSSDTEITDADGTVMAGATIKFGSGHQEGDQITFRDHPIEVDADGRGSVTIDGIRIAVAVDPQGGLTLSGDAPASAYEMLLQSLTFSSQNELVAEGIRQIDIQVSDDTGLPSNVGSIQVAVADEPALVEFPDPVPSPDQPAILYADQRAEFEAEQAAYQDAAAAFAQQTEVYQQALAAYETAVELYETEKAAHEQLVEAYRLAGGEPASESESESEPQPEAGSPEPAEAAPSAEAGEPDLPADTAQPEPDGALDAAALGETWSDAPGHAGWTECELDEASAPGSGSWLDGEAAQPSTQPDVLGEDDPPFVPGGGDDHHILVDTY